MLSCCLPPADKFERMKAVVRRYHFGEMQALDRFPDGSEFPKPVQRAQQQVRRGQQVLWWRGPGAVAGRGRGWCSMGLGVRG